MSSPGTAGRRTGCAVVGGGPAGLVLGLLLARAGVAVTVLEKHPDFLRDFRGDTVHASTLTLLDELGLGEEFAALGPRWVQRSAVVLDDGTFPTADLTRLPGPHREMAFVPQWDLLDLLARAGAAEPDFELLMGTEVTGLLTEGARVSGVRYVRDGRDQELAADLVVACDGRDSPVRDLAGLRAREFGVPMDVLWFRLPRRPEDPEGALGRLSRDSMLVLIDRGDYYQVGMVIHAGSETELRRQGIGRLRQRVRDALPWLGEGVQTLASFEDLRLLSVTMSRLRRWYADGLLSLGDAAHAMSPVAGVGINLAIQDAVAAARHLAPALLAGPVHTGPLRRVQLRRTLPTVLTQLAQQVGHRTVISTVLAGRVDQNRPVRLGLALLRRVPALQVLPAWFVAVGVLPEHAPAFARRPPVRLQGPGADTLGR